MSYVPLKLCQYSQTLHRQTICVLLGDSRISAYLLQANVVELSLSTRLHPLVLVRPHWTASHICAVPQLGQDFFLILINLNSVLYSYRGGCTALPLTVF